MLGWDGDPFACSELFCQFHLQTLEKKADAPRPRPPDFHPILSEVCDMPTDSAGQVDCSCKSIIQALVEAKANINPRNSRGATPLMQLGCSRQTDAEITVGEAS